MAITERLSRLFGTKGMTGASAADDDAEPVDKELTLVSDGERIFTGPPADAADDDWASPFSRASEKALRNAHKNPTVCAVVEWITDQASTTPYMLSRLDQQGELEVVPTHPLLDLLTAPSEFLSGREHLSVSIWDMILSGQTFWHKDRTQSGRLAGLTYLQAGMMTVKGSASQLITAYEYRPGRGTITFQPQDIVHIRIRPNPYDPKNGLSPLICVTESLYIDEQSARSLASSITGGAPGGLLMPAHDEVLDQRTANETKNYIQGEFSRGKRGQLGVLRARMEYINTALSGGADAIREVKNMTQEEICGVLGVHPVILGLGAAAAQSRVGAATIALEQAAWANRIIPLEATIAEQISRQLLPDFEPDNPEEWEIGFDLSSVTVLQPDKNTEATRWQGNVRAGISTVYDAKLALGLEATDADRVYLLANNIVRVPDGELVPDTPDEPLPDEPVDTPEEPVGEPDSEAQENRLTRTLLDVSRSKAELDELQRTMLLALATDADLMEPPFAKELEDEFGRLGDMAVDAFWIVLGVRALGGRLKQTDDEIREEVEEMLAQMRVGQWKQTAMAPLFERHYARVLAATAESVSTVLSVGVDIPDLVGRSVVQQGGTRLGLIDFSQQARDSLFEALHEGRSLGEGPAQLATRIRRQVEAGPSGSAEYRARLIARTETKYAQNVSTLESYRAAKNVTHVLVVDAQGAGRTDEPCEAIDGQVLTISQAEQLPQLAHPNCTRSWTPVVNP